MHLNDNTKYKVSQGTTPCSRSDPLIRNFQDAYHPSRELSIDESTIGFKGRLSFLQYLPKKPTKWGMKAFVLADSQNGYTYNWRLYTGTHHDVYNACTCIYNMFLFPISINPLPHTQITTSHREGQLT